MEFLIGCAAGLFSAGLGFFGALLAYRSYKNLPPLLFGEKEKPDPSPSLAEQWFGGQL